MSDPLDIDRALITAVQALALPEAIHWEGVAADPPENAVYLDVRNLPAGVRPVTMGQGGEDEHLGAYQIDVVEPVAMGGARTDAIVKELNNYFIAGRGFSYNGVVVTVKSVQRSPRRKDVNAARNRVAVSVFWRANLPRNTF